MNHTMMTLRSVSNDNISISSINSSVLPITPQQTNKSNSNYFSIQYFFICIRQYFTLKSLILVLLCCLNSGHALLTHYSKAVLHEKFSSTEVILLSEVMKLVFSLCMCIYTPIDNSDNLNNNINLSGHYSFSKFRKLVLANSEKIIILVILYAVANMLSYFALSRIDPAVYTVTSQLKVFTTALFSVTMLGSNITASKWRALILLVIGCILVASPSFGNATCPPVLATITGTVNDSYEENRRFLIESLSPADEVFQEILGLGTVLVMVTISGYTAIYFEAILKSSSEKISIWERNLQLSFYSILLLLLVSVWENSSLFSFPSSNALLSLSETNQAPFVGWSVNTLFIAALQAGGGLLVASSLKYADAVLKTLATSGSIVLSALLSYFLFHGTMNLFVVLGSIITIIAIFNYTVDS